MSIHNGSQLLLPGNTFESQLWAWTPCGVVTCPAAHQQPAIVDVHQKIAEVKAMADFPWQAIELVIKGLTLGDREGHVSGRGSQGLARV